MRASDEQIGKIIESNPFRERELLSAVVADACDILIFADVTSIMQHEAA